MTRKFKPHVDVMVTAILQCAECNETLTFEDDKSIDRKSMDQAAKKVELQAELEHWVLSDLGGKLDGLYPVCKECADNFTGVNKIHEAKT